MISRKCVFYIKGNKSRNEALECPYLEMYKTAADKEKAEMETSYKLKIRELKQEVSELNRVLNARTPYQIIKYNDSRRLFVLDVVREAYIKEICEYIRRELQLDKDDKHGVIKASDLAKLLNKLESKSKKI